MNTEKLISLINNPTNISNEDLEALKKLADEYPYFQIAHTLIAKTLGDNKSLAFKNRLHYASITSPDRNVLKKVIEGHAISYATNTAIDAPVKEEIKETAPKEEIVKEEIKEVENSADIVKERLAEIEGTKVEENLSNLAIPSVASASTLKITDKADDNILLSELEENLKSLQKAKEKNIADAKTKQTIKTTVKAKAKTVRKKITPTTKKTVTAKKTARKAKVVTSKKATPIKKTAKKVVATKKPARKVATSKKPTPTKEVTTKKTAVKKVVAKKPAVKKTTTPKKATPVKARIKKVAPVKASTGKVVAKKASTKKTVIKKVPLAKAKRVTKKKLPTKVVKAKTVTAQRKIIDAFIKKEPKIKPKKPSLKTKEKPQKDLSVESTKIKNDLVSENLAIIMEKQGKISKAKDIYKKLIWKFPQKKAYFATRIKELDKK